MPVSPDFEGFAAAQKALREKFGQDLTFAIPGEVTYPDGTPLDPETGKPFDPTIEPIESEESETTVRVSVVNRPIRTGLSDESERKAIGWLEEGGVVLIVDPEDWPEIENATRVQFADEWYAIRQTDHDYLGEVDRYLVWAAQE